MHRYLFLFLALLPVPALAQDFVRSFIEANFAADARVHSVAYSEILHGGPPKDGIRSIDAPTFVSVAAAGEYLGAQEPVIGVTLGGVTRAYPLRLLSRAEIANDVIGGVPVAVTYCPLCNTAIVFDRTVEGVATEFGVSGLLRNSDMIMYDRNSENLWQQFSGRAIVGALSATDTKLRRYASRLESFENFAARAPAAEVMSGGAFSRFTLENSGRNPYVGYDTSFRPFLFNGAMPDGIEPLARVVAVEGHDKAFALALLVEQGTIQDGDLTYTWTTGQNSALDSRDIDQGRDVGNVLVQRGSEDVPYEDVPYEVTFAFAYHAFEPEGRIVTALD